MIDFGRSKAYDFTGVEFLSKPITGFLENYHAAARDVVANDITMQRENHLKEIWGPITEELKDLGIQGIRDPSDRTNGGPGSVELQPPEDQHGHDRVHPTPIRKSWPVGN